MFRVLFSSNARRAFAKLPKKVQQKLSDELTLLAESPLRHRHTKKIRGEKHGYRLRLGRWRILFAVFRKEKRIEVVDIFMRKGGSDYRTRRTWF